MTVNRDILEKRIIWRRKRLFPKYCGALYSDNGKSPNKYQW